jgi:hypothetical protein
MKTALIIAAALVAVTTAADAQMFTTQRFGGQVFTSGPGGYHATQQTFGCMTFGNDNLGNHWTTQQFGGQTFTNVQPGFNNRGW